MTNYVTGAAIRALREKRGDTQKELAEKLSVSDKAVSKWETGRGLPDITLLEPLAKTLGVSVTELLSGECVVNRNRSANLLRGSFYVCPVCGNVLWAAGQGSYSCCGVTLPPLEPEDPDAEHEIRRDLQMTATHRRQACTSRGGGVTLPRRPAGRPAASRSPSPSAGR